MVARYHIDDHLRAAILVETLRFDSEKHDVELETNATQSKLSDHF